MAHEHQHAHQEEVTGKKLLITILLNAIITAAQIVGGLLSGSMSLLSDAAHNFSDVLALCLSYVAALLSGREHTLGKTFGFKRAGIFAAFLNAASLLVIATVLIREAIDRFNHPAVVEAEIVIWLAGVGIVFNGLSAILLHRNSKDDLNIRSAYLHLFTDMLTSIAVLIGGLTMHYFGWMWIDSVLTIGIGLYLIYSSWGVLSESTRIFMHFTPNHIDIREIADRVAQIDGVKNLHHVHVWDLNDKEMLFEGHLDLVENISITQFEIILEHVEEVLNHYGIRHSNIQPEYGRTDEKNLINLNDH